MLDIAPREILVCLNVSGRALNPKHNLANNLFTPSPLALHLQKFHFRQIRQAELSSQISAIVGDCRFEWRLSPCSNLFGKQTFFFASSPRRVLGQLRT
ncbi:hypothetical protein M513_03961 [Trichuris suis]|uniref:Uncharacterized protein n=1 Tax=Trichuris suis TaxID=68888 RepID=A0A085MCU7_9BILA|nr:hypothetical protein M513_03961 [Trichuris suis]